MSIPESQLSRWFDAKKSSTLSASWSEPLAAALEALHARRQPSQTTIPIDARVDMT